MTPIVDTVITQRAAAAVTGGGITRPAAPAARAWIESLTARAQIRSERHIRHNRPRTNGK